MSMTERGEEYARTAVSLHRSEELLCDRRVRCTGTGSYDHQFGRCRSSQIREYDLLSLVDGV